jgi:hypothetical protein
MVRKDGNLNTTLQAQAEGLLADQSSAIDFYNDIISDDKGLYKGTGFNFDPRNPLDDAGKKKFVDDYKEYFIQTQIAKTQDVVRPGEDAFTTTYTTPKPTRTKGGTGAKETAAQISQKTLDQKVKDVIKAGEGAVIGKGGRTLTKLDGRWAVVGSDGLPVAGSENITNPTILATFLGGSAKGKAGKQVELP